MLSAIGRWVARRRGIVLGAWALLVVGGVVAGGGIFDNTTAVEDAPVGSESALAQQRLDALDPEGEIITAVVTGTDFFLPALRESATTVIPKIRELPGVVEVNDPYTSEGLIGRDDRSSLISVELELGMSEDETRAVAADVSELLRSIEPATVLVGGKFLAEQEFVDRATMESSIGEGVAILVLFALLVVVLGGFRVAAFPIVAAIAVIAVSLLALAGLVLVVPVSEFAINIVTILSLGLAVDYSLLVIARYREERHRAPDASLEDIMARTLKASGRAVLISGLAVFIVLAGLLLLGNSLLTSMAIGGAAAVLLATLAGLTLVPALIAVFARHIPEPGRRRWPLKSVVDDGTARPGLLGRLAGLAQRRPVIVTVAAGALLVLMASPLATLTLGSSDIRSLPVDSEQRRTQEFVTANFANVTEASAVVVIEAPVDDPDVIDFLDAINENPLVVDADFVVDLDPAVTVVDFDTAGDVSGAGAQRLVHDIRTMPTDLDVRVAGSAAQVIDTEAQLMSRLPWAFGLVLLATFGLVLALTRSFVIPLKAVLLNSLSVAATLGGVVAIFQWGWGSALLGFEPWGAVDVTTPLLIGLLAFGLSMDYEVFLLARIHEEWESRDRTLSPRVANDRAVLRGIVATGPVVTTAAIAIAIVFLAFASGSLLAMKEVGVGMVIAIVLDVTIVRGLLLPALMTLLGRLNWIGPRQRPREDRGGVTGGSSGGDEPVGSHEVEHSADKTLVAH